MKPSIKKLVVLGATGGTGLQIVRQAIEHGHSVTAFVRSAERLEPFRGQISVREGDLLSPSELERAVEGHDAVLSAFGPRLPVSAEDGDLMQRFAGSLESAMRHAGVQRVVVESVAFLFRDSVIPPVYLLGRLFFPGIVADASEMERVLRESALDWTLVRPPGLTDKPFKGTYRIREGHLPRFGFRISRAGVADFMLRAVETHAAIRKIVGICN